MSKIEEVIKEIVKYKPRLACFVRDKMDRHEVHQWIKLIFRNTESKRK